MAFRRSSRISNAITTSRESITLVDKSAVPDDCKVTVVAGPKADYTPNEVSALKNYVENGGRAFFLLDPPLDIRGDHTADNTGLTDLLESWGVTLDKDLVLENTALVAGLRPRKPADQSLRRPPHCQRPQGQLHHPADRTFDGSEKCRQGDGEQIVLYVRCCGRHGGSWTAASVRMDDPKNKKGPFVLGAAGTYNTGKPNADGRFVVIGTSSFLANDAINTQLNRDLALNAVNWLSSDEDLISIRAKEPEDRKLDPRAIGPIQYSDFLRPAVAHYCDWDRRIHEAQIVWAPES